jgi:hypothetical protein
VHQVGPGVEPQQRSQRLARIRREMATAGHLALAVPARDSGAACPPVVQNLMQFICGLLDADLRDATGWATGAAPGLATTWVTQVAAVRASPCAPVASRT